MSHRKNILVGLTVLGAFVVLAWMILQFGGTLGGIIAGRGYAVMLNVPRVDGLVEGGRVQYRGIGVGRVDSIELAADRATFNVNLLMRPEHDIPANVEGVVRATNLISGAAVVELELLDDQAVGDLREVREPLPGRFSGADLMPPEIARLSEEIRLTFAEFREARLIDNFNEQVRRIGDLAESMNAMVGDEQMQEDVRQTLAHVRGASESAERIARDFEDFSMRLRSLQEESEGLIADARVTVRETGEAVASAREQFDTVGQSVQEMNEELMQRMAQVSFILDDIQQITRKIDDGEGTVGLLLNDPRLYAGLVDTTRLLEMNMRDLNRLMEQWEQRGFTIRLR